MKVITLKDLPVPLNNKIGFPWTVEGTPQYFDQNLPKITIITPSYNQGQYIEETIRSVLLQGYPNLEYIIIDGGSTDNTVDIIKKYESWITYWISEKDEGQSDAINKGATRSTGELINWLNSDDVLCQGAVWALVKHYLANISMDVFIGKIVYFSRDIEKGNLPESLKLFSSIEDTMIFSGMVQQALFYKMSIWRKLGGVNKNFFFCMDLDLWLRYLTEYGKTNVYQFDHDLAYFRRHDLAKTTVNADVHDIEKTALFLSLLKSTVSLQINLLENLTDYKIDYEWNTKFVSKSKLAANIYFWLINVLHHKMSIKTYFQVYSNAIILQPVNRPIRLYLHPIIFLGRKFLKKNLR
jgi:glycosyltransferase involved in cell wall biosynthesis